MNLDATFSQLAEEFQNTPIADTTLPVETLDASKLGEVAFRRAAAVESELLNFYDFATEEESVSAARAALTELAERIQRGWSRAMESERDEGAVKLLIPEPQFARVRWINMPDPLSDPREDTGWFRAVLTYVPVDVPRETP